MMRCARTTQTMSGVSLKPRCPGAPRPGSSSVGTVHSHSPSRKPALRSRNAGGLSPSRMACATRSTTLLCASARKSEGPLHASRQWQALCHLRPEEEARLLPFREPRAPAAAARPGLCIARQGFVFHKGRADARDDARLCNYVRLVRHDGGDGGAPLGLTRHQHLSECECLKGVAFERLVVYRRHEAGRGSVVSAARGSG